MENEVLVYARVAELADAQDLKSCDPLGRAGSIPAPGSLESTSYGDSLCPYSTGAQTLTVCPKMTSRIKITIKFKPLYRKYLAIWKVKLFLTTR